MGGEESPNIFFHFALGGWSMISKPPFENKVTQNPNCLSSLFFWNLPQNRRRRIPRFSGTPYASDGWFSSYYIIQHNISYIPLLSSIILIDIQYIPPYIYSLVNAMMFPFVPMISHRQELYPDPKTRLHNIQIPTTNSNGGDSDAWHKKQQRGRSERSSFHGKQWGRDMGKNGEEMQSENAGHMLSNVLPRSTYSYENARDLNSKRM